MHTRPLTALVLSLAIGLAACGSGTSDTTTTTATESATSTSTTTDTATAADTTTTTATESATSTSSETADATATDDAATDDAASGAPTGGPGGDGGGPGGGTTTTAATDTGFITTDGITSLADGSGDTTPAIVEAAEAFLATLTDEERAAVVFDADDAEQKARWSNFPEGLFTRDGLMWGNLSEESRTAWLTLMATTLSEDGFAQVVEEWNADETLSGDNYGTQFYWVALIGEPSTTDGWQWQWGGHHVTVNATVVGTELALTPSFIGAQPTTYTLDDGTTVEPLADITATAFALLSSLDEDQLAAAVLGDSNPGLVLGPGEDGRTIATEGLLAADMTEEQQALLVELIACYGGLANDEDAATRMATLEAELEETAFAWYGSTDSADAGYFRITGPSVVIELSNEGAGPGGGDGHIHGVYRDPTNDYGAELTS